jgi:hypothetical protein
MSLLSKYEFAEKENKYTHHSDSDSIFNNKIMTAGCPINKILPRDKQQLIFNNLGIPAGLVYYQNQRKWDVYSMFDGGNAKKKELDEEDDEEDAEEDEEAQDKKYKMDGGMGKGVLSEKEFNTLFHLISIENSNRNTKNKTQKNRK